MDETRQVKMITNTDKPAQFSLRDDRKPKQLLSILDWKSNGCYIKIAKRFEWKGRFLFYCQESDNFVFGTERSLFKVVKIGIDGKEQK